MVLGKLESYEQKNESRPHSYTTHKNDFKMDQRLKLRPTTIKIIEENRQPDSDIACSNILLDIFPQAREAKGKINKWDYIN